MNVEVNWWAVVLAAASTMVVGSIWYMPKVFGDTWAKLARVDMKKAQERGFAPMVIAILGALVTAYVLAHFTFLANEYFGNSFFMDALSVAFWGWLGFTAMRLVMHDAFEGRPSKLTFINTAHELVTFMVMGAIIGWLGV